MAVAASQVELWSGGLQAGSDNTNKKTQHHEWGEDKNKVLQLMLGQLNQRTSSCITTLDLLGSCSNKASDVHQSLCKDGSCENSNEAGVVELDQQQSLPCGWEKCLDLKTGAVYYVNSATGSRGSFDILEFPKQECDGGATGSNINEKSDGEGGTSLELKLNICASEDEKVHSGKRLNTVSDQSSSSILFSPSASSSSSSCSTSCVSSERGIPTPIPITKDKDDVVELECEMMILVGCPRCLMYVMASGQDPKCPRCRSSVLLDFPSHSHSPSKRIRTF